MNNLLGLLFTLAIAGVIVYGVRKFPWMDESFKQAIAIGVIVVAAILCILWLAGLVGHPIHLPD